jgi:hypothetical protein
MGEDGKQPLRGPGDGPVDVCRAPKDHIAISVTTNGEQQGIVMSEYNAWRVFGLLALLLGVRLSDKVSKAIKL